MARLIPFNETGDQRMTNVVPFRRAVGFLERAAMIYRELQAASLLKLHRTGGLAQLAGPVDPDAVLSDEEYAEVVDDFNRRHPLPKQK